MEQWLPIEGFKGYEVSDLGHVRSSRTMLQRCWMGGKGPGYRYLGVMLYRDGKGHPRSVHGLVLTAFVGPRPKGMQGCHGNGDRSDCALVNLRWDTPTGNAEDMRRHGTHRNTSKRRCGRGHRLVSPNLVPSFLRRGVRVCLACTRALDVRRRTDPAVDVDALADRQYVKIMYGWLSLQR